MKLCEYKGYEIHIPTSGGKAGTGHNVTSSIQVRRGNCIKKNIRFKMEDEASRSKAVLKAKQFADENQEAAK